MIINDDGTIWGEERDRKDELMLWLIDNCYFGVTDSDNCNECHYKKICSEHKKEIGSRWNEIYSNLQDYDRIHKEKKMKMEKK